MSLNVTVKITGFNIKDISEGLFNGPKGEFRFRIYITKQNTTESYQDTNRIADLPSYNKYFSWDKGYHAVNYSNVLDNMTLKKGDKISVAVGGTEIDDADENDNLNSPNDNNIHTIINHQNDKHSIVTKYFTMDYTLTTDDK